MYVFFEVWDVSRFIGYSENAKFFKEGKKLRVRGKIVIIIRKGVKKC